MLNIRFKKIFLVAACWVLVADCFGQNISTKLAMAYKQFESDSQLKHAVSSLYVINAKTGEVILDKNSQIGLAGASTQKIVTAATAFELLGKDYRYKTEFWKVNPQQSINQSGVVGIKTNGDPTFGSWRYQSTTPDSIYKHLDAIMKQSNLIPYLLIYHRYKTESDLEIIPDGWIWQDIGNYYGAGSGPFNWKENQFDIKLSAGEKPGDSVKILAIDSSVQVLRMNNQLRTGPAASGDNAYYYFFYGNNTFSYPVLKGTIPAGEKSFRISAAVADPFSFFISDLQNHNLAYKYLPARPDFYHTEIGNSNSKGDKLLYTHYSPPLDSIIYWFLKKSINLYGEALIKTLAYEKKGFGSTDSGVAIVKDFWKQKGIDEDELNIYDGSGLSPLNRITSHAQVQILKYAKTQNWFPYFYDALPEFNGIKMKSGTINDVKGFCGYHSSGDGNEYIFSFLVNNYSGRSSDLVNKMYKVLDNLK